MKSLAFVVLAVFLFGCNDGTQLQVHKLGEGMGLVTGVPIHNGETPVTTTTLAIDCGEKCAVDTYLKFKFRLTARAAGGSVFKGWSGRDLDGKCTDATADCEVLISWGHRPDDDNSPIVAEATFEPAFKSGLTVMKTGGGSGKVVSAPAGIDCGSTCSAAFAEGAMVTLTATPDTGSTFSGWSGGGCSGSALVCTTSISGAAVVSAAFLKQPGTVIVTKGGTGMGTVTSTPAGLDCGATCTGSFELSSMVTLTATPSAGSVFSGWGGACMGSGVCTVAVLETTNVIATFTRAAYPLTVQLSGTGAGRVSSNPAGIDCTTGDCTASFDDGTMVTLNAAAATGSTFTGWSGACMGTASTCTVTMSAAKSVGATFNPTPLALTVTRTGTGSGTVTSMPPGLSCGTTCTASFAPGTSVTLAAAADADSIFTGWNGGCSGMAATCTLSLMTAATVTANFDRRLVPVTVSKMGAGGGIVSSTPAGIDCGMTCAANFPAGASLSLTATPDADSVFSGWSGACTGTGVCTVTPAAATSVVATFSPIEYAFNIIRAGGGAGAIVSSPAGLSCGSICTARFRRGTVVTLTAAPDNVSSFGGWSVPACQGTAPCTVTVTADTTVTGTFTLNSYALSVTKNGAGNGTVTSVPAGISCGSTCSASFPGGSMVTLTATAASDSTFAGWSGACTGSATTCVVNVSAAASVQANFTLNAYTLTVNKAGTGTGTVSSLPAGITCGATCSSTYLHGTTVTLTATQDASSTFSGWSGACTGTGTCTVTLTAASTVTANFTLNPNTLAVVKAGTGSGTVTSAPAGISCGATCSASFATGTMVTLSASASSDSDFSGWSGAGCSGIGSCVVTLAASTSVTATFTLKTYALTVVRTGGGTGTVTSSPAGINCGATCAASFAHGSPVTLTAVQASGSTFAGWSGGGCTGTGTCTVTMTAATTVTATFNLTTHALTVSKVGTGTGTVTSSPTGLSCGATCSAPFTQGSLVSLTPVAAADSDFSGWSGACTGTGTCVVTMSSAQSVTASFTLKSYALTVVKAGTGAGTVTSSPPGIACGATCSSSFSSAAVVTLTAAEASGSTFAGWSGGGCTGTGTCTVTMTAATTVTATFTLNSYALTVARAGTGTGTVSSTPGGIACGGTCSSSFSAGTVVTLTAAESSGSTFAGWSGGGCTGTGTCTVTMTAATTVTATFTLNSYALTVSKAGTGTGTVTSSPGGVACGATCSASFTHGTLVTLTPTASADSDFTGWSGACTGTGSCVVTMSSAQSVTATFTLKTFALSVSKAGTGAGTVTSSPAGINCGASCSASYPSGNVVTLTAAESSGSTFSGWSGAGCTGTGTCTVTMTAARSVTATFTLVTYALTVNRTGSGTGTVTSSPAGISCGITCVSSFGSGTVVQLTATPAPGATFTGWSGAGCVGTGTCSVTMSAAASVTATFSLPNYAFVTSTVTTGAMGGLVGADGLCQQRAAVAGLPGTYRAWLSTGTVNAIDRLSSASGWRRTDGLPFVDTTADLVAGRILYPLRLDEFANDVFNVNAFATTLGSGVLDGMLSHCTDWTSTVSQFPAGLGNASATTTAWTSGSVGVCGSPQRLYCFGVDVRAVAQATPPAQLRRAFVSTASWTPGGGLASADAVCAGEAGAANLPGTYRALLTPLGASAASRFNGTLATWVRVDNVSLSTSAASFLSAPFWQAALDVTAAGTHVADVTWSGAANLAMVGSVSDTCNGWASSSVNNQAGTGNTNFTEVREAFGEVTSDLCNQPHRLLCLQE